MKPIEQISTDLFEKLRARSEDINMGDEEANDTVNPTEARFFNFDYKQRKESFGNITITVADKKGLKVFYSKNITNNPDLDSKDWYAFLKGLRNFAMRNLLTFDARDIGKSSLALRDIKTFAKTYSKDSTVKDIAESKLYGSTKSSYQKMGPVKLIVKHSAQVDENIHGARSRNIEKIFIENNEGERFKLESNNLLAGRVIARHVSNGGAHNDAFAKHVNESINELKDLRYFVMSSKRRQFEDATTSQMVESAVEYYNTLRETLHRLKGQRGYTKYMESFEESSSAEQLDEMTEDLKERFIQKYFDQRMEQAIPHIAKAYAATIREAAQVANQIAQFETGTARFGLNESDRDMLGLLEFTDKNAFMIKMLENISTKLSESDKVIAKFARHVMENWDTANKTNREMAGKLVRSYVKEIKDIVKKNHSIVEQGVAESQLDEGTWELPLSEKQVDKFIKLMASPLELGPDSDNATNALGDLFGDDELFDALASKADHQPDFDARPLIINRLLQLAAKPQSMKADDDELANMANLLNQLKTSDAGKTYVSKIDLILKKYPQIKSPEPATPAPVAPAPVAPAPVAPAPVAPPAPPAPVAPPAA